MFEPDLLHHQPSQEKVNELERARIKIWELKRAYERGEIEGLNSDLRHINPDELTDVELSVFVRRDSMTMEEFKQERNRALEATHGRDIPLSRASLWSFIASQENARWICEEDKK
jgi:hypothetical protein